MKTIEFDAKGKVLGRLATQIADALRGKNTPQFRPDRMPDVTVVVKNADLVVVTGNKEETKTYYRFSGYPGGLKREQLKHVRIRQPKRILTQAVSRMLPKNRLRDRFMKRLTIELSTNT